MSQALSVSARAAVATIGAYALTYALAGALSILLFRIGLSRIDATNLSTNLALLAFPAVGIWAFGQRRLALATLPPLGLAALLWLLMHTPV